MSASSGIGAAGQMMGYTAGAAAISTAVIQAGGAASTIVNGAIAVDLKEADGIAANINAITVPPVK